MTALNSSGPISLGGSTAGQSVNLALNKSATATVSFNDTAVRTLTGTSAGAIVRMPADFWGKTYTASVSTFFGTSTATSSQAPQPLTQTVVNPTTNEMYVIGNYTPSGNNKAIWVQKLNSAGQVSWTYLYYVPTAFGSIDLTLQPGAKCGIDSSGNLYIVCFRTTPQVVLFKIDTGANVVWSRLLSPVGTYTLGLLGGLGVDSSGNSYITIDVNAGGATYTTAVVKYNSSGTIQWQKVLNGTVVTGRYMRPWPGSTCVDPSGNFYFGGYIKDPFNQDGPTYVKCDSSGTVQWVSQYTPSGAGGTRYGYPAGMVTDSSGNLYVAAKYAKTTPALGDDTYVFQVDSTGYITNQIGITSKNGGGFLAIDTTNNLYVITFPNTTGLDFSVCKTNSTLSSVTWERNFAAITSGGSSSYLNYNAVYLSTNAGSYVATMWAGAPYASTFWGSLTYMLKNDGSYTSATSTFSTTPVTSAIAVTAGSSTSFAPGFVTTGYGLALSSNLNWNDSSFAGNIFTTIPTAFYTTQVITK